MAVTNNAYQGVTVDTTKYPSIGFPVRLPSIGGDSGSWGYILNNLLATSLTVYNSSGPAGAGQGFLSNVYVVTSATYTPALYPGELILANTSSNAITVTLPDATKTLNFYTVKKTDSSTNIVTVNTTSSQTIDGVGSTSVTIPISQMSLTFASDGSNWNII